MKKTFLRSLLGFLCSALFVLSASLPAFADMGPKPSVELKLYVYNHQHYAVTLLGNTPSTGPWNTSVEYRSSLGSYETWEAFSRYDAPEGYYFLGYFQEYFGDDEKEFIWGYYPPAKFYVLLYNMDTGEFSLSKEPVTRYAFTSQWQVLFDPEDGWMHVYANQSDTDVFTLLCSRLLITLLLELALGAVVFGLTEKAQQNLIGVVNLVTQIFLNLVLSYGLLSCDVRQGIFLTLGMEVLITLAEAFAYCRWLPWPAGKKPRPILYAAAANLLSFGVGALLNYHLSNAQLRWVGLGALCVWYAVPQLRTAAARLKQNAQETDKKL